MILGGRVGKDNRYFSGYETDLKIKEETTTSTEENKEVVRRLFEVINEQNYAVLHEIVSSDSLFHGPWGEETGPQIIKRTASMMYTAFPDHHFIIQDMVAEGDKVVTRFISQGTHKGDFQGIPPTGKRFTMMGMTIDCIADGKIVEEWEVVDQFGMMQQLGIISPVGGGG